MSIHYSCSLIIILSATSVNIHSTLFCVEIIYTAHAHNFYVVVIKHVYSPCTSHIAKRTSDNSCIGMCGNGERARL